MSALFLLLMDLFSVFLAWISAYFVRFSFLDSSKGVPPVWEFLRLSSFLLLIFFLLDRVVSFSSKRSFIQRTSWSWLGILLFISWTYFYEDVKHSRKLIGIFFFLCPFFLFFGQKAIWRIFRMIKKTSRKKGLFIGHSQLFEAISQKTPKEAFETVMFTDVFFLDQKLSDLSLPKDWISYLSQKRFDFLLLALAEDQTWFLKDVFPHIDDQIPQVYLFPQLGAYGPYFEDEPTLLSLHNSPLSGGWLLIKRAMDICGAFLALLLFSPVMAGVAFFVKLSGPGGIFYKQERLGLDGKSFWMYKFRSMAVEAELKTGAIWAVKNDHRTTLIGKWIRKTSLDELPQLWNVLRGDMSLVGPRPERPVFVQEFRGKIPGYMLRHKVKAGITGWAQVNGWRGDTSLEERIRCDLFYVRHWSLWLDIKILLMTVWKGFVHPHAY